MRQPWNPYQGISMPEDYRNIEIMMDYDNGRVVTLDELTPEWWL